MVLRQASTTTKTPCAYTRSLISPREPRQKLCRIGTAEPRNPIEWNIMKNLDDCERPACDDVKSMFAKALEVSKADNARADAKPRASKTSGVECPPNSATIGKGSWTLIHSMVRLLLARPCCVDASAVVVWTLTPDDSFIFQTWQVAWYPDYPTDDEKTKMKNFFDALARFYPCTYCADDFTKNLEESPVPYVRSIIVDSLGLSWLWNLTFGLPILHTGRNHAKIYVNGYASNTIW